MNTFTLKIFLFITGQIFLWFCYSPCLMAHTKDTVGMEISTWITPWVFGFAACLYTAEHTWKLKLSGS